MSALIAIFILASIPAFITGWARCAAHSYGPFVIMVLALLGGAAVCFSIKTSGLIGFFAALLLTLLAVSILTGVLSRLIYEAIRGKSAQPGKPCAPTDIIGFCGFSALAVLASALE